MLLLLILKKHFGGGKSKSNKYEYKVYIDFKYTQVKHKMMYYFTHSFKKQISSALRIHVSLTKLEQSESLKTFC